MLARFGDAPAGTGLRGMLIAGSEPLRPLEGSTMGGGRRSMVLSTARRARRLGRVAVCMALV